jgi:Ca2+-transporting ATPase
LGISLAISVIPEGLPATATIILTLGVKKMAKEQALVKKISYIETLGAVNVICSDKTGTLTKNQMTIKNFYANHTLIKHEDYNKYLNILMCGVYCNNSYIDQNNKILGDPTEGSFILFANNNIKN